MAEGVEIFNVPIISVAAEPRNHLPIHQTKAIKLSFLLHAMLICATIMLNCQTIPAKSPLVIDFTVETAEMLMEDPAAPDRTHKRQETVPAVIPPVTPVHIDRKKLDTSKIRVEERRGQKSARQEKKPAAPQREGHTTKPEALISSMPSPEEKTPGQAAPGAATSAASAGSALNKSTIQAIAPAAGNIANQGQSRVAAISDSDDAGNEARQYLRKNFDYIRNLIMRNLSFPAAARKLGWTGKILVSFIIREDGSVEDINIVSGSGHEVLDLNVISAIRRTAPFPKPQKKARFMLPIAYSLK
ncbi:MAG: energy transducer TonB [Proteobacteria bacterium]|nr:energy transducer TonB [Pseudomonadota bacterium]MBU0968390.1 energy transducer TonB [Pseudomonadota bacterium]